MLIHLCLAFTLLSASLVECYVNSLMSCFYSFISFSGGMLC